MSARDGGPAFPHEIGSCQRVHLGAEDCGMSVRDYFAAKAIPIYCQIFDDAGRAAEFAYRLADVMLKERAK